MNPLVAALLPMLINLADELVKAEGPKALAFLQAELDKLKAKHGK